jgi:hypothetical protein
MKYIKVLLFAIVLASCAKDEKNLIAKNQLGVLTNTTKFSEIESLFDKDSVVFTQKKGVFGRGVKNASQIIKIYDTSGQNLLVINPLKVSDSLIKIKDIRIFSEKFKTDNGIGLGSSFSELKKYHDVSNIQSSLKSVIVSLDELNALVSFDREVLPGDVRFDIEAEVKPIMIPDDAKINRFWINFETENKND